MKKIFTTLIIAAALFSFSVRAMAQGGTSPFVGSTHTYTVTMADAANTAQWVIADDDGTALDPQPSFSVDKDEKLASMVITWTTSGDYKIQFTENNETTDCATVKELDVTVSPNTFDVSTVTPAATCNAADGVINYAGTDITTEVSFVVDMESGDEDFNPTWTITFTLTSTTGAAIDNVNDGTNTLTPDGSDLYTLNGLSGANGEGSVTIYLEVTGDLYSAEDVVLTITSAIELTYNTPDVDSNDWIATQTINPIPQTSDITTD